MKKELLRLLGELADEAKDFGVYEQYSEATDSLFDCSDQIYHLTAEIVKLTTGKYPTSQELENTLERVIGKQYEYDSCDEDEDATDEDQLFDDSED